MRLLRDLFGVGALKVGGGLGEHGVCQHLLHVQIASRTVHRPLFRQLLDVSCGNAEKLRLLVGLLIDVVAQTALEVLNFALGPLLLHNRAVGLLIIKLALNIRFHGRFARQLLEPLHVVEARSLDSVSVAINDEIYLRAGSLVLLQGRVASIPLVHLRRIQLSLRTRSVAHFLVVSGDHGLMSEDLVFAGDAIAKHLINGSTSSRVLLFTVVAHIVVCRIQVILKVEGPTPLKVGLESARAVVSVDHVEIQSEVGDVEVVGHRGFPLFESEILRCFFLKLG